MNTLEFHNVGLTYFSENGETEAVKDVSFSLEEGEFIAILGPSGSGKTTILSLISGLIKPTRGSILIEGENINLKQKKPVNIKIGKRILFTFNKTVFIKDKCEKYNPSKTGYMFQKDHLFEWRNVLQNIYLGLEVQRRKTKKRLKAEYKRERKNGHEKKTRKQLRAEIKNALKQSKNYAADLLKKYGLWEFRYKYPNQLSGGMRQRVALIRTLALNPSILLLDEPFSALDYQTELNLCDDVSKIIKNENKTAILVTHDITEALSMANKIIVLTKRPAEIKNIHTIHIDENLTPLKRRESGKFLEYFDEIWKELQSDDNF